MGSKESTLEEYSRRINLIVDYINNNLDGELDLNNLANLASLSPFHFHRIFKAFIGEPLGSYVTRIRVETAGKLLRYTSDTVEEIAFKVGYEVPSSLSKAFKLFFDTSPDTYRKNKTLSIIKHSRNNSTMQIKTPKIQSISDKSVLYIRVIGEYGNVNYGDAWERLWAAVKEQKLFTAGIEHIGICHDDPKVTEGNKCRYDACLVIHKQAKEHGEIGLKNIQGGNYAIFLHNGPYEQLSDLYDVIFGKWLPNSGCELRNVPAFEKYLNNPKNTAQEQLKTEIYIPIT